MQITFRDYVNDETMKWSIGDGVGFLLDLDIGLGVYSMRWPRPSSWQTDRLLTNYIKRAVGIGIVLSDKLLRNKDGCAVIGNLLCQSGYKGTPILLDFWMEHK